MKSDYLRIRVSERFRTKAEVAYGATMAGRLQEVIPAAIADRIRDSQIDLATVARHARASGFAPGDLFAVDYGQQSVRAWLE